jgi:hypothetical protein
LQNVDGEEDQQTNADVEDSATVSASRAEEPPRRTILRLKFNPEPPPKKSKKRKHKHKRRTELIEIASSHSHGKIDKGKRKARDSAEKSIYEESNIDKEDSIRTTHSRKKVKRQSATTNKDANNNTQLSLNEQSRRFDDVVLGDSTDKLDMNLSSEINATTGIFLTSSSKRKLKEVLDSKNPESNKVGETLSAQELANQELKDGENIKKPKKAAGKKPLEHIEAGSSISVQDRKEAFVVTSTYQLREKRSYPPSFKDSSKSDDSRPSKVHKISSKTVQSVQESAAVITSFKSSEAHVSLQQIKVATTKDTDSTENLNGKSTTKDAAGSSATKAGPVRKLGRPPKSQETQRTSTQRSWTWQKKKKDLKTILNKLLDSFEK